ncbi:oxidoreductase FAD/NAD(P)-binding domain protein [Planctopirus limnophila DSM 3776]|uniref:Dihydroorotate dehydrogenase B (NAD(+)), electron transfer subunit n=1 Tax=Planctopirus limnophila (strain ATCC 43296 / DSM 3776 / IFAM 1008 / Mu 290) TaxID=521674 RepID=D5SZ53_PLAL2|nr:dihydroorotate dehydrogenase electron transfer subunit [Planctopirus limnophila]ADG69954.1 oxidoreductase FAD/NAD(P)-binding domain protein [Planctopirus limnophila DSM 3776]
MSAVQQKARVLLHEAMAKNTFRLRLDCVELATKITPGQFFMVKIPGENDPLLGRPFALFDICRDEEGRVAGLEFGYVVVGKMTGRLAQLQAGDEVEIWGPLGNGFPASPGGRLVFVAGGIGQTPFLALAREALGVQSYPQQNPRKVVTPSSVTLCYGARNAEFLAGVEDFQSVPGLKVELATDDGSLGHHSYVTQLLEEHLKAPGEPVTIYACGPEPMLKAVQKLALSYNVTCWLSLETPMACGFGACFSCVAKIRETTPSGEESWDYRRTCVEGPVFEARELIFENHP